MPDPLSRFQQRIGYQFKDVSLLQQALRHRSSGSVHNERLEYLGDSLLNFYTAESLYGMYPRSPEGELSAMRAHLVRKETLAEIARQILLAEVLELGQSAAKTGGHRRDSILSDTVEAVIAAVYLDGGWQQARDLTGRLLEPLVTRMKALESVRDAKSLLQEWLQAKSFAVPEYRTLEITGPGHARAFRVQCEVEPLQKTSEGEGSSRREAEQAAAAAMLEQLESLT